MTSIEDTTECRRHCPHCDVEWFGLPGCWNCGQPGDIGSVPTLEGLPNMTWTTTQAHFDSKRTTTDEDFRL